MSDVISAIKVENDLLINIDFDRPVWQNKATKVAIVPHPDHFVVDAILGAASSETLSKLGISRPFTSEEFEAGSPELDSARAKVYSATNFTLEYFNPYSNEPWIDEDLVRFSIEPGFIKIDEPEFLALIQ